VKLVYTNPIQTKLSRQKSLHLAILLSVLTLIARIALHELQPSVGFESTPRGFNKDRVYARIVLPKRGQA